MPVQFARCRNLIKIWWISSTQLSVRRQHFLVHKKYLLFYKKKPILWCYRQGCRHKTWFQTLYVWRIPGQYPASCGRSHDDEPSTPLAWHTRINLLSLSIIPWASNSFAFSINFHSPPAAEFVVIVIDGRPAQTLVCLAVVANWLD